MIRFVQLDRLFDYLADFGKDRFFIIPMASTVKQAGTTADEALIFVGPFDQLNVSGGSIHDFDSSIALLTARS